MPAKKDRTGEVRVNRDGEEVRIAAYRGAKDIDAAFGDGTVIRGQSYHDFSMGNIVRSRLRARERRGAAARRLGRTGLNRQGALMQVCAYRAGHDVTVRFEDGSEAKATFANFRAGEVRCPGAPASSLPGPEARLAAMLGPAGFKTVQRRDRTGAWAPCLESEGLRAAVVCVRDPEPGKPSGKGWGEGWTVVRIAEDGDGPWPFFCCPFSGRGVLDPERAFREPLDFLRDEFGADPAPFDAKAYAKTADAPAPGKAPSERVGLEAVNSQGRRMRITAYRGASDVDIEFEDGAVVRGRGYRDFRRGLVRHPGEHRVTAEFADERVGQTRTNGRGLRMTVSAYRGAEDMDVVFEDGAVVRHTSWGNFDSGGLAHPDDALLPTEEARRRRLGERRENRAGLEMRVAAYRNAGDIDVEFGDGAVAEGVTYSQFAAGAVTHPSVSRRGRDFAEEREGEERVNRAGEHMRIAAYRSASDIDVAFDDGSVARGKNYSNFKRGRIAKPGTGRGRRTSARPGEARVNSRGKRMVLKAFRGASDCDVAFDDGAVREGVPYARFRDGSLAHPDDTPEGRRRARLGERRRNRDGEETEVFEYRSASDIDVIFEDGSLARSKTYAAFRNGAVRHP